MKIKLQNSIFSVFLLFSCQLFGQDISLFNQFNGRYDFTFVGNTMNDVENNGAPFCKVLTTSTANLNLLFNEEITAAYLYWSGSGTGDFDIKLNGIDIIPDRTFELFSEQTNLPFFSAFTNVSKQIISTGNGNYTVSNFDVSSAFVDGNYCNNATNFAGWALIIVYHNENLPLNQVNIYDGLQAIPRSSQTPPEVSLNIPLTNLNVIDNIGAKIGFLSWEGDKSLDIRESLIINGNLISNPPLNPVTNIFNGTNSITGSDTFYNMDLDIFEIQNNISVGDQSALIQMTSGQDFVMINTIVTKFNNQLPDATIEIDLLDPLVCNDRTLTLHYTVYNNNSLDFLPAGIPIAVYSDETLLGQTQTQNEIPINGSENGIITITIPNSLPPDIEIRFKVDDLGNGIGIQKELIESNNNAGIFVSLLQTPKLNALKPLISCNEGLGKGTFNFMNYEDLVRVNFNDTVTFYESLSNAENEINAIFSTSNYVATQTPKEIFIRLDNENCFDITSFLLTTENCPPEVFNYISANDDGINETFQVEGLRDVFVNFKIEIYNRWGKLVWTGNNATEDWNGLSNQDIRTNSTTKSPRDTYFYIIYLNDPKFPEPLIGYIYLFRKNER